MRGKVDLPTLPADMGEVVVSPVGSSYFARQTPKSTNNFFPIFQFKLRVHTPVFTTKVIRTGGEGEEGTIGQSE